MYIIKKNFENKYWVFGQEKSWSKEREEAYRFISYSMAKDKSNTLPNTVVVLH